MMPGSLLGIAIAALAGEDGATPCGGDADTAALPATGAGCGQKR